MDATQFYRVAKAIADARRFEILEAIALDGELSCKEIVEKFTVSQATISHHLKELINAGIVKPRREGQYCYYKLCPGVLADYIAKLEGLIAQSQGGCRRGTRPLYPP